MSLTQTTVGAINQMMAVDGTTAVLDAIHGTLAFTKTGGVGNTWLGSPSNFRTILGASAPVIAQATDNLLPDEAESFEGNTVDTWSGGNLDNCTAANDATQGYHGGHCLAITVTANGNWYGVRDITAYTSYTDPYTASAWLKANNAAAVGKQVYLMLWSDHAGVNAGTVVTLTTNWQRSVASGTFSWQDTQRQIRVVGTSGIAADLIGVDAIQLEAGAVQTPFALDSRTACTMRIPTATIGLVPGQDATFVAIVNGPWAGNDGIAHYLLDVKGAGAGDVFSLYKHTDNKLYFAVGDKSAVTAALDATTWAANVNHVVIGTVTGGTINVYLAGTAGTAATGATREAALNANIYVGTKIDGTLQANTAILPALYGRVLTVGERGVIDALATWTNIIDLPQITVTGLATGNAVRLYDAAGNIHASAVETGGTATLTYTLD